MDNNTENTVANPDQYGGVVIPANAPEMAVFLPKLRLDHWVNFVATCHDDRSPSLGMRLEQRMLVTGNSTHVIRVKCWAGCTVERLIETIESTDPDSHSQHSSGGLGHRPSLVTTGVTLPQWCDARDIDIAIPRWHGARTIYTRPYNAPAVVIPYRDRSGDIIATQIRVSLDGDCFRWVKGSRPTLYGQQGLDYQAHNAEGHHGVIIVEGCTDCWACWGKSLAAVGVPGAGNWREEFVPLFDGITDIYAVIEPDQGGRTLRAALEQSALRNRITFIEPPPPHKDAAEVFMKLKNCEWPL